MSTANMSYQLMDFTVIDRKNGPVQTLKNRYRNQKK
jgi:hypothetical protein